MTAGKKGRALWVGILVVAAVFVWLYGVQGYAGGYGRELEDGTVDLTARKALWKDLVKDYGRDGGEWGFGYFVPLAVAGLFWVRRKEILAEPVRPALLSGAAVLLVGFLFYWAGYRGVYEVFWLRGGADPGAGGDPLVPGVGVVPEAVLAVGAAGDDVAVAVFDRRISAPLQAIMVKLTSGFLKPVRSERGGERKLGADGLQAASGAGRENGTDGAGFREPGHRGGVQRDEVAFRARYAGAGLFFPDGEGGVEAVGAHGLRAAGGDRGELRADDDALHRIEDDGQRVRGRAGGRETSRPTTSFPGWWSSSWRWF